MRSIGWQVQTGKGTGAYRADRSFLRAGGALVAYGKTALGSGEKKRLVRFKADGSCIVVAREMA